MEPPAVFPKVRVRLGQQVPYADNWSWGVGLAEEVCMWEKGGGGAQGK